MAEFTTPTFLENYTVDDIYATMSQILPADIDRSEGSHVWNLTRPTALVLAEICEFVLPQVVQLIFPEWSYGDFLDAHAQTRGLTRKAATAATGEVTFTGLANTLIPAGTVVSTASLNSEDPSISYATTEEATIPASGTVTVDVECTETGTVGNTIANTIIILASTVTGITAVTNADEIDGGTDTEDDASLIARIEEYDSTQGDSYIGNIADYKRWALSVSGVGNAAVIPANDTTGLVTIILTDSNGDPANETLCDAVYNYIMQPEAPASRLAPINALLSVEAPETISLGIIATVELEEGATLEAVKSGFYNNLVEYLPEALSDEEIKVTKIEACLSNTAGVNDFQGVEIGIISSGTVSYSNQNIAIASTQLPTVLESNLLLTAGTVERHGGTEYEISDDGAGNVTISGANATNDGSGNTIIIS